MISIFKKWFAGKPQEVQEAQTVVIGGFYTINDGSPWPVRNRHKAKVLDAKDGWVRYYLSETWPDERMRQHLFLSIYKKDE